MTRIGGLVGMTAAFDEVDAMAHWTYREEILRKLEDHSLFPRPHTDPLIVRDFLKALYTMEIRTMRVEQQKRERAGDRQGRREYANRVVEMRKKYDILSVPVEWWTIH